MVVRLTKQEKLLRMEIGDAKIRVNTFQGGEFSFAILPDNPETFIVSTDGSHVIEGDGSS